MIRDDRGPTPDEVGDYWDALVSGQPAAALDASFRATIDRLRALDDARSPHPAFVGRLERALSEPAAPVAASGWVALPGPHAIGPNGREHPIAGPVSQPSRPHWPSFSSLATAALVLLTLAGSLLLLSRPPGPLAPGERPAGLPSLDRHPLAPLAPGVGAETVLMRQVIAAAPEGPVLAQLERITLGPASSMVQGTASDAGVGPTLYRIDRGAITARADGPVQVTRAETAGSVTLPAATDVIMRTGDTAFIAAGVATQWHTDDAQSAEITIAGLDLGLIGVGIGSRVVDGVDVPNWAQGSVLAHEMLLISRELHLPAAPVELMVRRLVLDPGARLAPAPPAAPTFVYVETGTLAVTEAVNLDPFAPVEGFQVRAGSWLDAGNARYIGHVLGNDDREPLVLLVMTVTPYATDAAAPPASVDSPSRRDFRPRA